MTWNKEEVNEMQTQKIRKNHMDILWHEYTDKGGEEIPVTQASLTEKASIVGRVGIMLLSCGTGAWRVRSSMNRKGQALVEFVLILPIFILILFAVIDFGMILNKKNELENNSVDIVDMLKSGISVEEIQNTYPNTELSIKKEEKYTNVRISEKVKIITPGLNRVLGNPYIVNIERNIPNE